RGKNMNSNIDNMDEIQPNKVEELLKNNEDVAVLDVREDEEVAMGMIEDAIHIPLANIPYNMDKLSKDKHYITVCRSGSRSNMAAAYLWEHGFKVANMAGGMLEWDGEIII